MTTNAPQGHAQKGPPHRADLLIHDLHAQKGFVLKLVVMGTKSEKACASQVSVVLRIGGGGQQITCNLLPRKLIERLVLVVAVDNVFTKPISVGKRIVSPASGRIGM